ncbi:hypothetical protein [Microlunatus sp. Y2014]|uniref:hypothetical protein n=1 Tax=Microlunatus sp. Y2014 TaxID=3418488 RepID=UPI003DA70AF8
MTISAGIVARHNEPAPMEMWTTAGARAIWFYPMMTLLPGVVTLTYDAMMSASGWFGQQGLSTRERVMNALGEKLGSAPNPVDLFIGGGVSAIVLGLMFVVFSFTLIVELILAKYALLVMTCLVPALMALALHPRFRTAAGRLLGALAGTMLVPIIIHLVFWIGGAATLTQLDEQQLPASDDPMAPSAEFTGDMIFVLVVMFAASMAPIALAMVMPKIIDGVDTHMGSQITSSGARAGDRLRREASQASHAATRLGSRAAGRARTSDGRVGTRGTAPAPRPAIGAAKTTGAGSTAGTGTTAAAATTKAGAAATGPTGMAAAAAATAAKAGVDGTKRAEQEVRRAATQASGPGGAKPAPAGQAAGAGPSESPPRSAGPPPSSDAPPAAAAPAQTAPPAAAPRAGAWSGRPTAPQRRAATQSPPTPIPPHRPSGRR